MDCEPARTSTEATRRCVKEAATETTFGVGREVSLRGTRVSVFCRAVCRHSKGAGKGAFRGGGVSVGVAAQTRKATRAATSREGRSCRKSRVEPRTYFSRTRRLCRVAIFSSGRILTEGRPKQEANGLSLSGGGAGRARRGRGVTRAGLTTSSEATTTPVCRCSGREEGRKTTATFRTRPSAPSQRAARALRKGRGAVATSR